MNDTDLVQRLVDSLDTGLPERPDLTPVRSAGARQRRRRRLGWTAGACAAAGALVVPAVVLIGGDSPSTFAPDIATAPKHAAAPAPAAPLDALAGPEFGTGMRSAVETAVPGATFESEQLADGWLYSQDVDSYVLEVSDPVQWETLFAWTQDFGLSSGAHLGVVASRVSSEELFGGPGPATCDEAIFPSRESCEAHDIGGQRVLVNDGVQYDDAGRWARQIDVSYFDLVRGTTAHVELTAYADAPTWAQASDALPSVEDLMALGQQEALLLPAPDHYPVPDDLAEHVTTTP
jgi:hypothetical protein